MINLADHFRDLISYDLAPAPKKRGRPKSDDALSNGERQTKHKNKRREERQRDIAVLDMETDPFDDIVKGIIKPFVAYLYSDQFEPVLIWEESEDEFIAKVCNAIEGLPRQFTIYAHNGGRFDFLFLVRRLRGKVSFKGRGIMSARIGEHELRDSFHIIPEKLAAFQKQSFDYTKMRKDKRNNYRNEIIAYLKSDCVYLFDIVKTFIGQFGLKLSIGQAAMYELKRHYDVKKISDGWDNYLRTFFYGGRVECLKGRGLFKGDYKLYDVNSLYPFVMAGYQHPIGDMFDCKIRRGDPGPDTVFIDLEATNRGALIGRNSDKETVANISRGRFHTSIWEFDVASRYGLIDVHRINFCIDCLRRTDFSKFVNPLYANRLTSKAELDRLKQAGREASAAYVDMKKDDIFYKLLLNNAYGKFAQNPRKFKEHYITDPDETPPPEWMKSLDYLPEDERGIWLLPEYEGTDYWIWAKPNPMFSFNNVGTAASITGAARAVLLDGLMKADNPIYCDTDSIICRGLSDVPISKTELGAWDMEDEFTQVVIDGKKLYSTWHAKPRARTPQQLADGLFPEYTIKSKGSSRLTWREMLDMLAGKEVIKVNRAPTLTRYGTQTYVTRTMRATAPLREHSHAASSIR